jgi:hypothetical protein
MHMGRPKKEKSLLLNIPLRIMLTSEQRDLIGAAAGRLGLDIAAWARPILLEAARERALDGPIRKKRK